MAFPIILCLKVNLINKCYSTVGCGANPEQGFRMRSLPFLYSRGTALCPEAADAYREAIDEH